MSNFVSWEYYNSLYSDIKQSEFAAKEKEAEAEIRSVIGYVKWQEITPLTYGIDALKECICKLMHEREALTKSGQGKGLASVTNDGYSETFAIKTREEINKEMASLIKIWLSGTGLIGAY